MHPHRPSPEMKKDEKGVQHGGAGGLYSRPAVAKEVEGGTSAGGEAGPKVRSVCHRRRVLATTSWERPPGVPLRFGREANELVVKRRRRIQLQFDNRCECTLNIELPPGPRGSPCVATSREPPRAAGLGAGPGCRRPPRRLHAPRGSWSTPPSSAPESPCATDTGPGPSSPAPPTASARPSRLKGQETILGSILKPDRFTPLCSDILLH